MFVVFFLIIHNADLTIQTQPRKEEKRTRFGISPTSTGTKGITDQHIYNVPNRNLSAHLLRYFDELT